MIYDTQRLKEDADCRLVALEIGMTPGNRAVLSRIEQEYMIAGDKPVYFQCPNPEHQERTFDNFAAYRKRCRCYSCGWTGDVFQLVKDYKIKTEGREPSFSEICRIMAGTAGDPADYMIEGETEAEMFPLTEQELELIGLHPAPGYMYLSEAPGMKIPRTNIKMFFREDREACLEMMADKASEKALEILDRYQSLESMPCTVDVWRYRVDAKAQMYALQEISEKIEECKKEKGGQRQ